MDWRRIKDGAITFAQVTALFGAVGFLGGIFSAVCIYEYRDNEAEELQEVPIVKEYIELSEKCYCMDELATHDFPEASLLEDNIDRYLKLKKDKDVMRYEAVKLDLRDTNDILGSSMCIGVAGLPLLGWTVIGGAWLYGRRRNR